MFDPWRKMNRFGYANWAHSDEHGATVNINPVSNNIVNYIVPCYLPTNTKQIKLRPIIIP